MKKFYLILLLIIVGVVGVKICGELGGELWANLFNVHSVYAKTYVDSGTVGVNLPEIYIKAVNPGYTVDGKSNAGEMIELGWNKSANSTIDTGTTVDVGGEKGDLISLAGLSIGYTNSSGNTVVLIEFSKYMWMVGETLTFRLASAPDGDLANLQYTKTLAMKAGPLTLMKDGVVIDSVCWTGKDGCYAGFSNANPTTLVRNLETGDFEHLSNYVPDYAAENLYMVKSAEDDINGDASDDVSSEIASQCKSVEFSEILSYYESLQSEQFIELYNSGTESVRLDGCKIKYKNKTYNLSGVVSVESYYVYYPTEFKLTKNPATSNTLELLDVNGDIVDRLEYPNGQKKGTSYALIGVDGSGEEIWKTTYAPTPGEANNYQEYRTCEVGKVINEATGNCVKVTSVVEKICGEGQYLNILTGRCKKYEATTSTECKEGYYLYAETGRCRKIQENTGADYTLVPETYEESSSFTALYLVAGVAGVGLVYVIYEFRHEIGRVVRRVIKR